ncbi:MAG: RDD family protein [Actinobacteria bacterium]|nr:RDD family protein [Actinomycetota bacterium]
MDSLNFDPDSGEEGGFPLPIASTWRRVQAITIDWIGSLFASTLLLDRSWTLLFFFFQVAILTALTGSSAGQRLRGIRIIDVNTLQNISPLGALLRTFLILLVIPAVIQNKEGRGLHDLATKSAAVRF